MSLRRSLKADEIVVALAGVRAGREPIERRGHRFRVLHEIQHRAVLEEAAPLRIEPDQVEVIFHPATRLGEDAAQHGRNRDDGRPHVEAEAGAFELRGLAAEPFVALEEDDLVAARGERAGGGESAESAADDADAFVGGSFHDVDCSGVFGPTGK